MSAKDGYRGYSNMGMFPYLSNPQETFSVPSKSYFALGDNSYFSKDSRDFGGVPEQNVAGRGLLRLLALQQALGLHPLKLATRHGFEP